MKNIVTYFIAKEIYWLHPESRPRNPEVPPDTLVPINETELLLTDIFI